LETSRESHLAQPSSTKYRAPSWSWASKDCHIQFTSKPTTALASIDSYEVELVDEHNPTGQIRSAVLVLSALVASVTRLEGKEFFAHANILGRDNIRIENIFAFFDEEHMNFGNIGRTILVPLVQSIITGPTDKLKWKGLILKATMTNSEELYVRIGYFFHICRRSCDHFNVSEYEKHIIRMV
jgi:hypothetical protein